MTSARGGSPAPRTAMEHLSRWLHALRGAPAVLLLASLASCTPAPANVLGEQLEGGRTVADLVARDRPTVVLVYPPGYCFVCAPQLAEWQQFEREGRIRLAVILADDPSEEDRRAFILRRIHVSGVLKSHGRREEPAVPREYLVEGGRVRLAAVGTKETGRNSMVLRAVAARPRGSLALDRFGCCPERSGLTKAVCGFPHTASVFSMPDRIQTSG